MGKKILKTQINEFETENGRKNKYTQECVWQQQRLKQKNLS